MCVRASKPAPHSTGYRHTGAARTRTQEGLCAGAGEERRTAPGGSWQGPGRMPHGERLPRDAILHGPSAAPGCTSGPALQTFVLQTFVRPPWIQSKNVLDAGDVSAVAAEGWTVVSLSGMSLWVFYMVKTRRPGLHGGQRCPCPQQHLAQWPWPGLPSETLRSEAAEPLKPLVVEAGDTQLHLQMPARVTRDPTPKPRCPTICPPATHPQTAP